MARKSTAAVIEHEVVDPAAQDSLQQTTNQMVEHSQQIMNTFGDGLPYERMRIVNEARFYMAQSAEAMLEAGKRLVILKEHEPHGDFAEILENQLGIEIRIAQKMMQASMKFLSPKLESNAKTFSHLGKAKLYDLMLLDDEVIENLADGGSVSGMTLDDIDRMSCRELRKALRETREDNAAKSQVIADKSNKIDELHTAAKKVKRIPPDEVAAQFRKEASLFADEVEERIRVQLTEAFSSLQNFSDESGIDQHDFLVSRLSLLDKALLYVRGVLGIERTAAMSNAPEWEEA